MNEEQRDLLKRGEQNAIAQSARDQHDAAELDSLRKRLAFCQESLTRIRDMAPPHSAIVAHIDVLLAFLRRTA